MKFIFKYGILILLFFVLIEHTHIYYDFTASNSNIIIIPGVLGLMFFNFLFIYIFEAKKKNNHKITNWILVLFIFVFGINLYLNYTQSIKKILYEYYVSRDINLMSGGYNLKLYEDGTYVINEYWHGESQHYFGEYTFENNQLILNDKNIEDKTNTQITTKYIFNTATRELKPVGKKFPKLKAQNN